jgi:Leucine-rich repeat (LRR) protein
MSSYEDSKTDGCAICMNAPPSDCISPNGPPNGGCQHFACKECWKQAKKTDNKCFVCRKELPYNFPPQTTKEFFNGLGLHQLMNTNVKDIVELDLQTKQIFDLTPIASLVNLKTLYLGGNQIFDLTPLASLVNLKTLNLTNNRIVDITPLSSLTELKNLDLSKNNISDLSPFSNGSVLKKLEVLYLHNNKIVDLSPIKSCENIKEIRLMNNPIIDFNQLDDFIETVVYY